MLVAKQVADLLTFTRVVIGAMLVWLGLTQGTQGLPLAVLFLTLAWTSDALDGPVARRSRDFYHTWIGDHDLQVDMFVSAGLLGYLWASGFVSTIVAVVYVLIWLVVFYYFGDIERTLGMLSQAPIYGWFIWVAMRNAPLAGRWLIIYLVAIIIVTWPRFPKEVVPGFLSGISQLYNKFINSGSDS
jgi:cardiolipin synthase